MSDRLIPRDDYILTVETTKDPGILYNTIAGIADNLSSSSELMEELETALPDLIGLDFVIISYYNSFVTPSSFEGYSVLALQPAPDQITEQSVLLNHRMLEFEISRVLIIAVRPTTSEKKFRQLKEETEQILKTRINFLERL